MAESADDRLRLLIERIERLEEEKKGISDDIKDVYAEAKATGYDARIMREVEAREAATAGHGHGGFGPSAPSHQMRLSHDLAIRYTCRPVYWGFTFTPACGIGDT